MKKLVFMFISCGIMIFVSGCATLHDSRTNPSDSTAISSEWAMLEFLLSDENANKRSEYEDCNGKDSAICEKILDSWRKLCTRGEEKYCIGAFYMHFDLYIESFISDTPKQKSGSSKIDKYLTLLKQKCDNGKAESCHAVGSFYNELYLKIRRSSKEEPHKEQQMLDNALLYFQKSCDLGVATSCMSIARYWSFQGNAGWEQYKIYKDKARKIVDKDCKAGVKMACDYYKDIFED